MAPESRRKFADKRLGKRHGWSRSWRAERHALLNTPMKVGDAALSNAWGLNSNQ